MLGKQYIEVIDDCYEYYFGKLMKYYSVNGSIAIFDAFIKVCNRFSFYKISTEPPKSKDR